jgi:hypothetical protein
MKLLSITWNYTDESNYKDSLLYKSFIKKNDDKDFIDIHFNRNNYKELETKFEEKFGYQYEFILYKIHLLGSELKKINDDVIIYADTNDVVCLIDIKTIHYDGGIIFSSEKNKYPSDNSNWSPNTNYPQWNLDNGIYLNSGLILTTIDLYIKLIKVVEEIILHLDYKNFGGDQGVYTYYYINNLSPQIILDHDTKHFLSTYLTSTSWFEKVGERLRNKLTNTFPSFVHDNGWNYGSPRIIENFNLQ